ncbi:MAG: TolC family protein [Vicingaceae bacterium]
MKTRVERRISILIPLLLLHLSMMRPVCLFAQVNLSVDQLISTAVENNPQIKVSYQNLEFSRGSFRVARSGFNTNILLNGLNSKNVISSSLGEPASSIDQNFWSYSLGASRKFAFGTIVTPSFAVVNSGSTAPNSDNIELPVNQGTAFINLEQPLLRGLGTSYNLAELRVAELGISSQEHRYLFDASSLLLDVMSSYVEYISARLNLQIQQDTEASMAETVRQMDRLVELDAIPGSELVVSQANLANQQTNTAIAENRYALAQNSLATTLGIPVSDLRNMGEPPLFYPMESSVIKVDEVYTNSWISQSLTMRHDFLATTNDVEASEITLDFSQKGMLPRLNLTMGAGYNGLYQAQSFDQFYRPYFSNVPGMSYSLGLSFDIAPRYDLQKGRRIQALALKDAADANIRFLELQISKEVRRDCDQLKFFLGATQHVNEAVEFYKESLKNEKKKLELGSSTAFNVALMQNNYLNALERQNALLQQLNQAILQFKYHTGTLVDASGNSSFSVNSGLLFVLPVAP